MLTVGLPSNIAFINSNELNVLVQVLLIICIIAAFLKIKF